MFPDGHNVQRFLDWTQTKFADESLGCASYSDCAQHASDAIKQIDDLTPSPPPKPPTVPFTNAEIQTLASDVMTHFDENGDGDLSHDELTAAFTAMGLEQLIDAGGGSSGMERLVNGVLREYGTGTNGELSRLGLVEYLTNTNKTQPGVLRYARGYLDGWLATKPPAAAPAAVTAVTAATALPGQHALPAVASVAAAAAAVTALALAAADLTAAAAARRSSSVALAAAAAPTAAPTAAVTAAAAAAPTLAAAPAAGAGGAAADPSGARVSRLPERAAAARRHPRRGGPAVTTRAAHQRHQLRVPEPGVGADERAADGGGGVGPVLFRR